MHKYWTHLCRLASSANSRTSISATALRLAGAAAGFFSMRISFSVLGVEGMAAIAVVQAVSGWLFFVEAGTGMAGQNYVATARSSGANYAAGLARLLRIPCYIVLGVIPLLWMFSDTWQKALGSGSVLKMLSQYGPSIAIAMSLLVLGAASGSMWRIYYAEGRGMLGNLIQSAGSLISFLAVFCLSRLGVESFPIYLFALLAPAALLPFTFLVLRLFVVEKPTASRANLAPPPLHELGSFLLFNIASALVLRVDVLILSRVSTSVEIATFVCVQRIMSIVMVWPISIQGALQPSVTAAWSKQDKPRLQTLIRQLILTPLPAVLVAGVGLVVFDNQVASLLTAGKISSLGWSTITAACIYYSFRIWTDAWSVVMLAIGRAKKLVLPTIGQGVLLIPLIYFFGHRFGAVGCFASLATALILTTFWWAPVAVRKAMSERATPTTDGFPLSTLK